VSHWVVAQLVPRTVPATEQLPMPEIFRSVQMPSRLLPDFVQVPVQHSLLVKQVSLTCLQYETVAEQVPPMHAFEQQSALDPHGSPEPRHAVVSALQWPVASQRPLQHCVLLVHAAAVGVSGRHAATWQVRFAPQLPEQQSDPVKHAWPVV
jgi:hypothetical protein